MPYSKLLYIAITLVAIGVVLLTFTNMPWIGLASGVIGCLVAAYRMALLEEEGLVS